MAGLLSIFCWSSFGAPAEAEIDSLLSKLQSSGCRFGRNGAWYNGSQARAHLLRKWQHLEQRIQLENAEAFIEAVATRSTSSGTLYQVSCGDRAPIPSHRWMKGQLDAIRQPKNVP
jgi:Family of unknown function (DUF5329)